jgi:hypothetical protein
VLPRTPLLRSSAVRLGVLASLSSRPAWCCAPVDPVSLEALCNVKAEPLSGIVSNDCRRLVYKSRHVPSRDGWEPGSLTQISSASNIGIPTSDSEVAKRHPHKVNTLILSATGS